MLKRVLLAIALALGIIVPADAQTQNPATRAWVSANYCALAGCTMTGALALPNGTAGAPTLRFGDATTGFYRATANTISIAESGAEILRFTNNAGNPTLWGLGNLQIADSSGNGMWQFTNATKTLLYQAQLANGTYIDAGATNPSSATGSSAPVGVNIGYTWNTSGAPTLIKANVTNTASSVSAMLMDLQVGGTSRFNVTVNGVVNGQFINWPTNVLQLQSGGNTYACVGCGAAGGLAVISTGALGFNTTATGNPDVALSRTAASTMALGNGTVGDTSGSLVAGKVRTVGATVSGLGSAATAGAGARGYVTDATACTFGLTLTGGGSTGCPAYSDGTNWKGG